MRRAPLDEPLAPPGHLQPLLRAFVAEEVAASLRHGVRNRVAAVRNSGFFLRRRVEQATHLLDEDPRVGQFFQLIEDELVACSALLDGSYLGRERRAESVRAGPALLRGLAEGCGARASVEVVAGGAELPVRGDLRELELALFCLLENAVEAAGEAGTVRLAARPAGEGVLALEVTDSGAGLPEGGSEKALTPFFSTKPGRLGLGLNIARRVAGRFGGRLELGPCEPRGVRAALVLPA